MVSKNKRALRPNNLYHDFERLRTFQLEREAEAQGIDKEDSHLYALSQHAGWAVIKEYMNSLIADLDNMIVTAMQTGANLEDIGQRTMLATLSKEALKKVIAKVDDAKEIVEAAESGRGAGQEDTGS